jgi:hypothetical protein
VRESRSGAGVIEDKSHDDRVPQLAGLPTVVAAQPTLFDEPEALVETSSLLVVGPDLECGLVRAVRPSPVHNRVQEHRSDAKPSVPRSDLHTEVSSPAAQVCAGLTDEPPVVFHYESNRVWVVKIGTPSFDAGGTIEWGLRSEPLVLTDDGIDQLEQPVEVIGRRRSHGPKSSLYHDRMMLDPEFRKGDFAAASWRTTLLLCASRAAVLARLLRGTVVAMHSSR